MLLTLDIATHPSWYLWSHPRSFYRLSQNSSPRNLTTLPQVPHLIEALRPILPSITHCTELNYHTLRSLLPSRCIKVWTLALRSWCPLRTTPPPITHLVYQSFNPTHSPSFLSTIPWHSAKKSGVASTWRCYIAPSHPTSVVASIKIRFWFHHWISDNKKLKIKQDLNWLYFGEFSIHILVNIKFFYVTYTREIKIH
jgi:hypothetical protein